MGFFKNLFNKVGNAVGKAVEAVGEFIGSTTISSWGWDIQCNCDFGEYYDSNTASVEDLVDLHQELEKLHEAIDEASKGLEERVIEQCSEELKKLFDAILSDYNSREIERLSEKKQSEVISKLQGCIKNYASQKLSLDNEHYKKVLNIKDDNKRNVQARGLKEKILREAQDDLLKKYSLIKSDSLQEILRILDREIIQVEDSYQEKKKNFDRILAQMDNSAELEEEKVDTMIQLKQIECLEYLVLDETI